MKEMAALIPEVLASDVSTYEPRQAIIVFTEADNMTEMFRQKHTQQVVDRVVQMLREATLSRYSLPGDSHLMTSRLNSYANPEYLGDSIPSHRLRALLRVPFLPDYHRTTIAKALNVYLEQRSNYFGVTASGNSLGIPPKNSKRSYAFSLPSSKSSRQSDGGSDGDSGHRALEKLKLLNEIQLAIRNDKRTDVEVAVERARTLLPPLPHASLWFSWLPAMEFAQILSEAHIRNKRPDYVSALSAPKAITHFEAGRRLFLSLIVTPLLDAGWLRRRQDFKEAMQLAPMIANDGSAEASIRFEIAWWWANWAWGQAHPSISTAYEATISFTKEALVFSPTLQTQHFRLVEALRELEGCNRTMPRIRSNASTQAGDRDYGMRKSTTLDRNAGPSYFYDQLHVADPASADQFAAINRNLESVTMSVAQSESGEIGDGETGTRRCEETDSIGQLLAVQRTLLEKRNSLISHIRSFPGFENFLGSPSFDALNSAAAHGPIVIINQSIWRSDIVILLGDLPPSVTSTSSDFHNRTNGLKDQLLHARKKQGLDTGDYTLAPVSVLADLYELVGKPSRDSTG
ncbi:hypothetical protein BJY52DRAFT_1422265 [Lactarius psammicola]|nr:hypothetical protein BJY52DRAFT_1422265 [Lactarius psammicola]